MGVLKKILNLQIVLYMYSVMSSNILYYVLMQKHVNETNSTRYNPLQVAFTIIFIDHGTYLKQIDTEIVNNQELFARNIICRQTNRFV